MNPTAFIISIQSHYLDQFRTFVEEQQQNCVQGSAEVKFQIGEESGLFRGLCCVDFIRNDGQVEPVELQPDFITFEPISGRLGGADFLIEQLQWNDVVIHHTLPAVPLDRIDAWFEHWFDPDDERYVEGAELGDIVHSLAVQPKALGVDFGTASPDAFWSLLSVLEAAGAAGLRISTSQTQASS
ncbi:hypothetical protein [Mesorhizobium sp. B2-3-4]|uniref:hypothetical protein n=1 Tax=Mesorhizobium sp. B2-3-4 TaxID=2589959 RepID=UPI00112BB940|nr:hypothetical protein [Mesorhizobium sp. B2-3-4]TPM39048.1 hypothetical protein FJ967_10460 [Mesorhizobium sp. B2-3-4]